MASDEQSSLLRLSGSGGVENLLLSYVSSGDGGLNAILNLRQVCSTTKNWVEALPPPQAEQIFGHCQAKVDLHEIDQGTREGTYKNPFHTIRKFLKNPLPAHVKSLKLCGVRKFTAERFSPQEDEVWRRFAWFWWRRLESLEVDYVDNLLRPKDSRVNLLLSLSAHSLRRFCCDILALVGKQTKLPASFVLTVAGSSASICTEDLHGKHLYGFTELVGEDMAKDFFRTVESIDEIERTDLSNGFLLLFPNLQGVSIRNTFASEAENNEIAFPLGLKRLWVEFVPKNLPPALTFLGVIKCKSSVFELLDSLAALDKRCPLLKSLFLNWSGDYNFQVSCACCTEGTITNHQEFQSTSPFRNLKWLHFWVDSSASVSKKPLPATLAFPAQQPDGRVSTKVNGAAWVLLNGLKLPQLSLRSLKLCFLTTLPPLLDRSALISLIQGDIAKSLVDVKIDGVVAEDALPLKAALEVVAEEIAKKRRNLVGPNNSETYCN